MAAHRIFCTINTLSEIIRLRKERPYSSTLTVMDKLGDLHVECTKAELTSIASSNPIVNKLLKRPSRNIYCIKSACQEIKTPLADDIFLLMPPESKPYSGYREKLGTLITRSLTDLQVIDDLCYNHYRPYNLLTSDQKRKLSEHGEEYEDISSWKDVLSSINIGPINSAIIIDNYLLSSNFERRKPSLYNLIQTLVPFGLSIPFHLTIFVYNKNGELKKEKMETVVSEIHNLKLGSKIMVSIVSHTSGDVTHDRMILTNYHLITSGHGFGVIDNRGVRQNAQGEIVSTFHSINTLPSFNSIKHRHSHVLDWMKDIYVDDRGMNSLYAFEVGDKFNNRLLSE